MKTPSVRMWAVIVHSKRSQWIHPGTIARTRRDAWDSFLGFWLPEARQVQETRLKTGRLRLARVTITEQQ